MMNENVKNATYVSVWDGGIELKSKCKVNMDTNMISNIHPIHSTNVEVLEAEYVEIDGTRYPAEADYFVQDKEPGVYYYS